MNLIIILFIVVTVFLLLLKLFGSLTGRVSERLLTSHFRALEALLEHDKLPAEWGEEVRKMAQNRTVRGGLSDDLPREEQAKSFLLKKIRSLHKYFETSPFVESPETRALLLEQLEALTEQWESAELSEILAEYDLAVPE